MTSLSPGVVLKLLGEMGNEEKAYDDCKPVLLQIRSITPVLAEGDLWPNQGFFLKVSDFSHAMYVSLPQEKDEMVLCNKLQLGQFIYVERLEAAYPVPMIKGIRPIPGRHPCIGDPKDIVAIDNLEKFCGVSNLKMILEDNNDSKKPKERFRSLSASKVHPDEQKGRRALPCRSRNSDVERESYDISRGHKKNSPNSIDNDSDCDSTISNLSSLSAARRKSWNGIATTRSGEVSDSTVVKHVIKPIGRSRSASVSPVHCYRYYSSADNSNFKTRSKDIGLATKSVKSSNKSRISLSKKSTEKSFDPAVMFSSFNDKKSIESEILWDCLPSTLEKLGKEVLRQRDVAVLAAIEALQEASVAERLLKCLSTYSKFQSAKEDDQQPSVDKFFNLQQNLAHTRLIVQSLTNISPLRTTDTESNNPGSVREALKVALDRNKNATSWIKMALASDLAPVPAPSKTRNDTVEATDAAKRLSKTSSGSKPKGTFLVKKPRNNGELHVGLEAEKDNEPDWVKGSALSAAAHLANSLHDECRTWFLAYVENYLDEVNSKSIFMESDSQVSETMCQIKRVNDWLEAMVKREGCKENSTLDDSEFEAYGRMRNKIYGILLKNVERTAMVLGNMNGMPEG